MNRNPFLNSNNYVPHTFSNNPPKSTSPPSQNTLKALIRGQITGNSFRSLRHLSNGFFSHMNKAFNSLATLVVELEDSIVLYDGSKCDSCLLSISKKISELTSVFYTENREWFVELNGHDLLVRILESPPPHLSAKTAQSRPARRNSTPYPHAPPTDTRSRHIRNKCMAILRELCLTHPFVCDQIAVNDRLITFLFTLLSDLYTFDMSIALLEEILCVKEDMFDLSRVPGFNTLVRGMTKSHLGVFCRVLAMVVFEADDRNGDEIVSSLELLRSRKRGRCVSLTVRNIDRNHAIVLGIPNLLERLVSLLRGSHQPFLAASSSPSFSSLPFTDILAYHYQAREARRAEEGSGGEEGDGEDEDEDEEEEEGEDEAEDGEMQEMQDEEEEDDEFEEEEEEEDDEFEDKMEVEPTDIGQETSREERAVRFDRVERTERAVDRAVEMVVERVMDSVGPPRVVGEGRDTRANGIFVNMDEELEALMDGTAQHLRALALSTYQVELLFILYALLAGKRKAELQDRLAGLGLIHTATLLFDRTDWLKPPTPLVPHERTPHGPQCECNPDAALKIQLLRLILNFCDGDFENRHNKRLLLSREELAALYPNLNVTPPRGRTNSTGPGLLSKLMSVFYKLPQDQNNRFWMASCIEAFLRGSEPMFQKFVAESGMLAYLIDDIVSDAPKVQGSLQTSFDLLGELMKFNRDIFADFNKILVGEKSTKFLDNVATRLVDSNVFLRGMILSIERFMEEDRVHTQAHAQDRAHDHAQYHAQDHAPYPFATCKISLFLQQNWTQLVRDLMTVVSIDAINQENICCVNTTLVFCIHARRKDQLRDFIAKVRDEDKAFQEVNFARSNKTLPTSVTENFQKLLWFWHEYYLLRGKDCLSLEYTSQIPFSEWTATYDTLVEELGNFDPKELYAQWEKMKE